MSELTRRDLYKLFGSAVAMSLFAPNANAATTPPHIRAYRNPGCSCCEKWAEQLKQAGFAITMEDDPDLEKRRTAAGVPADVTGCHTAFMGGYVIEGHVPIEDIKRLLAERPAALGLAVPGMPAESPGMENGGLPDNFTVFLFKSDGEKLVYANY